MSLPHLHLFHPAPSVHPTIMEWLAESENYLSSEAHWDSCAFRRVSYTKQSSFNVGTEIDNVREHPGPAIFIQKVQQGPYKKFKSTLEREVAIIPIAPRSAADIIEACEQAKEGYDNGEPLLPHRELIAYLIVVKLAGMGKWGGTATNKSFLWATDLPKGGFPKDIVDDRDVQQVADALLNASVLTRKRSQGQTKYALGNKQVVQPILDTKNFENVPKLRRYFDKSRKSVSARYMS